MSNPNFSDEVLDSFISYVRIRSAELSSLKPNFMSKIIPGYDKFMIPQNMYEYLRELTGVDPMDKETAEAYLTLIEPVVEAAGVKLNKTVPEFNYEDLDFNNKAQMEALKELRNDPEFQRYFNLFQPDFDSYLESLKKNKYLKDAQCFVMQDGKYIGWLNSSIYKEDSKKKTLLDIFVFQAFRGKGLAKKIILDYINYAQLDEILLSKKKQCC
jgi:GNAT superfamily N-acetyltransferase